MIGKVTQNIIKLQTKNVYAVSYNILKPQNVSEEPIPLYHSKDLSSLHKNKNLSDQVYDNKPLLTKYLSLIPFWVEAAHQHPKHLVTKMSLLPNAKLLKLECLSNSSVYEKFVSLENVIPVCHEDYRAYNRRFMLEAPTCLDNEMIYFNTSSDEFYVFDRESVWNEEGLAHPALDLNSRFNEKQWFDHFRIV